MNERTLTAITVSAFLLLGGAAASLAGSPPLPAVVALLLVAAFYGWIQRRFGPQAGHSNDGRVGATPLTGSLSRIASLLFCYGVVAGLVLGTGGVASAFTGLLYLPILLAALAFRFEGGVLMGIFVSLAFALMGWWGGSVGGQGLATRVLLPIVVFNLVAVAVGSFAEGLRRTAEAASEQAREAARHAQEVGDKAREQQNKAAETEAFLDTSVMMENMYDLDNTLAIALIRLSELVPADVSAVFLRDGDGVNRPLHLSLLTGMPGAFATVPSVGAGGEDGGNEWRALLNAQLWPDAMSEAAGLGELTRLDPDARTIIVAPLRTLENFLGLIYVSSHKTNGLTERHCELIDQFARHIVFPIQRVRLQALATTDVMTGLANHRSFRLRLADEVQRAYRYGHAVSLLLLDIDHFKRFNDTYGHPAGDALLSQMGQFLRGSLRSFDIPARYGGEEMAMILPETSAQDAYRLAERIRREIAVHPFVLPGPDGMTVPLTVSIGVATLPDNAAGDAALIEQADQALYFAKRGGRNAVRAAATADCQTANLAA